MQVLVELNWMSFELLERQLVHEERIQSTATDKISTINFQNLTLREMWLQLLSQLTTHTHTHTHTHTPGSSSQLCTHSPVHILFASSVVEVKCLSTSGIKTILSEAMLQK